MNKFIDTITNVFRVSLFITVTVILASLAVTNLVFTIIFIFYIFGPIQEFGEWAFDY